jgi:hypothetical protein
MKETHNNQINLTACVAGAPWRQVIWGVSEKKDRIKMGFKNHWLELSLAIIVILLAAGTTSFGVDKSLAWIVGICTALIAASVAIIKNHQESSRNCCGKQEKRDSFLS